MCPQCEKQDDHDSGQRHVADVVDILASPSSDVASECSSCINDHRGRMSCDMSKVMSSIPVLFYYQLSSLATSNLALAVFFSRSPRAHLHSGDQGLSSYEASVNTAGAGRDQHG